MSLFEFAEPKLDEDLAMLRTGVRRYVNESIIPFAEEWEATGEIPRSVFRDLGKLATGTNGSL